VSVAPVPLPPGSGGGGGGAAALTDGLTGGEMPYDTAWVAFFTASGGGACAGHVEVVVDLGAARGMAALGVHALQVPPVWFRDGSGAAPVQRNLSAALPAQVAFAVSNTSAAGPWVDVGSAARPTQWAQEGYDVRTDVLTATAAAVARWVRADITPGVVPTPPPLADAERGAATDCPLVLLSEVFVLEQQALRAPPPPPPRLLRAPRAGLPGAAAARAAAYAAAEVACARARQATIAAPPLASGTLRRRSTGVPARAARSRACARA
jgi:hypothetical protein